MKKNTLYLFVLFCWWSLVLLFSYEFAHVLFDALRIRMSLFLILLISACFSLFFLLNYIRDIIFSYYFFNLYKPFSKNTKKFGKRPEVEILYYVHNDFSRQTFQNLLDQRYGRSRIVVLDDSTDALCKKRVNYHTKKHNTLVIRRPDQTGYKAGSLNRYLTSSSAQFFVIVDSNGVIHKNFIRKALPYFVNKRVAAVQANHIKSRSKDELLHYYTEGKLSHSDVYQTIKSMYGFVTASTHGIMIRKEAYDKTDGFTYDVAEDLLFSLELSKKGYITKFAPDVLYLENPTIHCAKCNTQRCNWTITNLLFLLSSLKYIMGSRMRWYEKLDIYLFLSSIPSSIIYTLYLINFLLMITLINLSLHYTLELQLPLLLLLSLPLAVHARYQWNQNREMVFATVKLWKDNAVEYSLLTRKLIQSTSEDFAFTLNAKKFYNKILMYAK